MYQQGMYTDTALVVEGKAFPVHRVLLAAASGVFASMFRQTMQEGATVSHSIIMDPVYALSALHGIRPCSASVNDALAHSAQGFASICKLPTCNV